MHEELGVDDNINLNEMGKRNLSYLYHGVCIVVAYLIPVTIFILLSLPSIGPNTLMFIMMIFIYSCKTFAFVFLSILFFKNIIEENLFTSYFVCTIISYISFYWFNPYITGSFLEISYHLGEISYSKTFLKALFILGLPLFYCALSFLIYSTFIKKGLSKKKRKLLQN